MTSRRVSSKQYQAMLASQNGKCVICKEPPPGRLRVDGNALRARWTY
jgi:hypothetical protein